LALELDCPHSDHIGSLPALPPWSRRCAALRRAALPSSTLPRTPGLIPRGE